MHLGTLRNYLVRFRTPSTGVALAMGLAACGAESEFLPPGPGPLPFADRVKWHVIGHEAGGVPALDETTAYFPTEAHNVVAIDRGTGTVRWVTRLPVADTTLIPPMELSVSSSCVAAGDVDLWCLDPATGGIRWRVASPPGESVGYRIPAQSGGVVFTGTSYGHVVAVDAATGVVLWSTRVDHPATNIYSPIVRGNSVYATLSRVTSPEPRHVGAAALALDRTSGAIRWLRPFPEPDSSASTLTTEGVVEGPVLVAPGLSGNLYAFDTADGTLRWTAPPERGRPGDPAGDPIMDFRALAASSGLVFVTSIVGSVIAYRASDGVQVWAASAENGSPFMIRADSRQVFTTHAGGQLSAMDVATGKVAWVFDQESFRGGGVERLWYPPAADATTLYQGGFRGLYAFTR